MQNENKMEWWFPALAILCVLTTLITLAFSISSVVMTRKALTTTESTAMRLKSMEKDFSITIQTTQYPVSSADSNTEKKDQNLSADPDQTTSVNTAAYLLKEYHGKIGVYTAEGELLQVLSVTVSGLPEADKTALSEGIAASSYSELVSLIEDFS